MQRITRIVRLRWAVPALLALLVLAAAPVIAQQGGGYTLPWHTVEPGQVVGDLTIGYGLRGVVGQPDAHPVAPDNINITGGGYTLTSGFLSTSTVTQAQVSLEHIQAQPGDRIQMSVQVAALPQVVAGDLTIQYDAEVLDAVACTAGSLTDGWSIACNRDTPGSISVALASLDEASNGAGTLLQFEMDVIAPSDAVSPVAFPALRLHAPDGEVIPVGTDDGSVTVVSVAQFSIQGRISQAEDGTALRSTVRLAQDDTTQEIRTDANGHYTVTGIVSGTYTLTPVKTNATGGIRPFDASLVLRHVAQFIELRDAAAIAADVDRNGAITAFDAHQILRAVIGVIDLPFPGAEVVWLFDPPARQYDPLNGDQVDQDFTGILLGDVSRYVVPASPVGLAADPTTVDLSLVTTPAADGGSTIAVHLDTPPVPLSSLGFTFAYETAGVQAVDVQAAASLTNQGFVVVSNTEEPGIVRVAMASATPLMDAGAIFTVTIQADQPVPLLLRTGDANMDIRIIADPESTISETIYLPLVQR